MANYYEDAHNYYYGEEDYNVAEAVKKYMYAAINGYVEAYYELSFLYIDEYDDKLKAFEYMKLAADNGLKKAYFSLAEMYQSKDYGNYSRKKAIDYYLKDLDNKDSFKKIKECLKSLNLSLNKKDIEWYKKYLGYCYDWYNISTDLLKDDFKNFGVNIFRNFYNNTFVYIKNIEELNNYKESFTKYKIFFSTIPFEDNYWLKLCNFLYAQIKSLDDAKKIIDIYNTKLSKPYMSSIDTISKINHWIFMYYMKEKYDENTINSAIYYLDKIDRKSFNDSDLEIIKKYIESAIKSDEYSSTFKIISRLCEMFYFRDDLKKIYDSIKARATFQSELLKAMEFNDYEARLYVANAYLNGYGTEKDISSSIMWYMAAFAEKKDLKSICLLYNILGDKASVIAEFNKYFGNDIGKYDFNNFISTALQNDFLNARNGFMKIDNSTKENDLIPLFPKEYKNKCSYSCNQTSCDRWWLYKLHCSNYFYKQKYYDDYCLANESIFDCLFKNCNLLEQKEINIVLVGCGNFYELKTLNEIAKNNHNLKMNIILLDDHIWAYNKFDDIISNIYFNSLSVKNCDFYDELKKDAYKFCDLIYYSRCLDHHEYTADEIIKKLNTIINQSQLTVFSQAVNASSNLAGTNEKGDPIRFENDFRKHLKNNFNIIQAFRIDIGNKGKSEFDDYSRGINYFAYVIEGRK